MTAIKLYYSFVSSWTPHSSLITLSGKTTEGSALHLSTELLCISSYSHTQFCRAVVTLCLCGRTITQNSHVWILWLLDHSFDSLNHSLHLSTTLWISWTTRYVALSIREAATTAAVMKECQFLKYYTQQRTRGFNLFLILINIVNFKNYCYHRSIFKRGSWTSFGLFLWIIRQYINYGFEQQNVII